MGKRSAIEALPEALRIELAQGLKGSGWGDIDGWTAWLAEQGYEISRSAVGRFNAKNKKRFEEAWADAEQTAALAKILVANNDDNSAMLRANEILAGDGLMRIQLSLRDLESSIEEMENPEDAASFKLQLAKAQTGVMRGVADLNRAGIARAKWEAEIKAKIDKSMAALESQTGGGPGKLDAQTLQAVREQVYGIIG